MNYLKQPKPLPSSVKSLKVRKKKPKNFDRCILIYDDTVPKRIEPTHNIPVCNLQMRGYLPQQLDFYSDFARRAAYHMGMPCSGTIPLPTQTSHWTVIRSPFVHKKSQENFERKTHKRLLQIKDAHPEVVERWIKYLTMNAPAGIGMRATKVEFEALGKK